MNSTSCQVPALNRRTVSCHEEHVGQDFRIILLIFDKAAGQGMHAELTADEAMTLGQTLINGARQLVTFAQVNGLAEGEE